LLEIRVAGTSAGDAWAQWNIGTTRSYSLGIDNSDSDNLKLTTTNSASIDPSSGTFVFKIDPVTGSYGTKIGFFDPTEPGIGGVDDDFWLSKDKVGSSLRLRMYNQDNSNVNSHCGIALNVGGTSAGDPGIGFGVLTGATWILGLDNSDSDKLKIGRGDYPSSLTVTTMITTTDGEVTFPNTPAFSYYLATVVNDITGNGTLYSPVAFDTVIFDQNSDFASNIFTAPVTGRYRISFTILLLNAVGATSVTLDLVTSNRRYREGGFTPQADGTLSIEFNSLLDMDALDTAYAELTINGVGSDTIDLAGAIGDTGSNPQTWIGGELVC
jgi:hypothetical protein